MDTWNTIQIQEVAGGCVLGVHAQPGAKREAIVGEHGGLLKIAVTQKPTDGKANGAIIALLSKTLGIAKSNIEIRSGQKSRQKRFLINSINRDQILERLSSG